VDKPDYRPRPRPPNM
uniref:Metalnikowin-1 n=2 Tax=Pentatominae TaxID=286710 RepID=MK1_PALPR|nr:RecName: Full=Metalnikowin-1; AltName: Full=Metalnikowin I [Palomena prasina]5HCP_1z Chain 1z, Metalnikowin-1 [Palomena prasina]5HCP_2z Chain 2z, Metalnikowin-1 [Palomena prasina]